MSITDKKHKQKKYEQATIEIAICSSCERKFQRRQGRLPQWCSDLCIVSKGVK